MMSVQTIMCDDLRASSLPGKMKPIIGDIVFLFGAGASKGAAQGHVRPDSPPLMTELYDRLAKRYPSEWGPANRRAAYADRYRQDFEKAFTELDLGRAPDLPPGVRGSSGLGAIEAQWPLAVYFSEFRLDGARKDSYSRLLNYLLRSNLIEDCFFSSLNYECLFEQAVRTAGSRVDWLLEAAAAPARGTVEDDWPGVRESADVAYVAKLHDPCNFNARAEQMVSAQLSTGHTHVETRIDASDPFTALTGGVAGRPFPIMTQISPNRDDFLAPGKIFQLRQIWGKAIGNASLIVVIGVAPRPYDGHVWEPLAKATDDIVYIGGRPDADAWRRCNPRFRSIGSTFRSGFRHLLRCVATHSVMRVTTAPLERRSPRASWTSRPHRLARSAFSGAVPC
jgi:hypothetical protein